MALSFAITLHAREIRERSKLKSSVQRPKEIILMAWQNVARFQSFERSRQSCA